MISNQLTLLALSALTLVTAQSSSNFTIDPNTVDRLTRSTWCNAQQDSCQTLCGAPVVNTCDRTTLEYMCECEGGNMPDLSEFAQTIPSFICNKLFQDCIVQFQMDADGQANCTKTYKDKCGTEDVNDHKGEAGPQPTTTSATTSATAEATPTTEPESSSSKGAAAAATAHAQLIGNGAAAVALGLLAYAL